MQMFLLKMIHNKMYNFRIKSKMYT